MNIIIRTVSIAGVPSSSGAPAHHRLVITAALQSGPEAPAEQPGALARAAHQLALQVALAALHLAGVAIARVAAARLTEALDEVAALGVDLGALEQLAPGAAPHLAQSVVELGHAATLDHREGAAGAVAVEAAAAGPDSDLVPVTPVGHVAEVPHAPLAVVPRDLNAGGHETNYPGPRLNRIHLRKIL